MKLTGSSGRETSSVRRPHVRVDPLPALHRVVYGLLHPEREERKSEKTVDSHGRPDHPLDDPRRHTSLVSVAERAVGCCFRGRRACAFNFVSRKYSKGEPIRQTLRLMTLAPYQNGTIAALKDMNQAGTVRWSSSSIVAGLLAASSSAFAGTCSFLSAVISVQYLRNLG